MSRKKLFKNNSYGNSIFWNEKPNPISVIISDRDGKLIKRLKVNSMDWIIVPPDGTVELMHTGENK